MYDYFTVTHSGVAINLSLRFVDAIASNPFILKTDTRKPSREQSARVRDAPQ